jgi:hypothetical protein
MLRRWWWNGGGRAGRGNVSWVACRWGRGSCWPYGYVCRCSWSAVCGEKTSDHREQLLPWASTKPTPNAWNIQRPAAGTHVDAVIDGALITVADDGEVIVSHLTRSDWNPLAQALPLLVPRIADGHRRCLAWHGDEELRQRPDGSSCTCQGCRINTRGGIVLDHR